MENQQFPPQRKPSFTSDKQTLGQISYGIRNFQFLPGYPTKNKNSTDKDEGIRIRTQMCSSTILCVCVPRASDGFELVYWMVSDTSVSGPVSVRLQHYSTTNDKSQSLHSTLFNTLLYLIDQSQEIFALRNLW